MSSLNELYNKINNNDISIEEIAKSIVTNSKKTISFCDLDKWLTIFNLKKIFWFEIDNNNNQYIINNGQLIINYYKFYFEELNLFDDEQMLLYKLDPTDNKFEKFEKYYQLRKEFVDKFIKK